MARRKTTAEFVEQASKAHENKYDYSKVNYINNYSKVIIICKTHGEFKQTPTVHLLCQGCPQCSYDSFRGDFIKTAQKIHKDKYDYSLVNYKNNKTKVKIICKIHGVFTQIPRNHTEGKGCGKCSKNALRSTQEFIKDAKLIHKNKYDYSESNYINSATKVKIICKIHGLFTQTPNSHINGKQGCPSCGINKKNYSSKLENKWLDRLNIRLKNRQKRIKVGKRRFLVDGFDPETNTIYEFYGDYWHGNPNKFRPNKFNKSTKCTFGELFKRTKEKEYILEKAGFNLVTMWEGNFIE